MTAADRRFQPVSALIFEFCAKIWYVFNEKAGRNLLGEHCRRCGGYELTELVLDTGYLSEAAGEYRSSFPEARRTQEGELFFCVRRCVRSAAAAVSASGPDDNFTECPSSSERCPMLLISERSGVVSLRTNYFKILSKGRCDIVNVAVSDAFLELFAGCVLSAYPASEQPAVPLPDNDLPGYAAAVAVNTALRSGFAFPAKSVSGDLSTAFRSGGQCVFAKPERNVLLRLLHLIYTLPVSSCGPASGCPAISEAKKKTGNAVSKLSGPLLTLAVSKAAADYSYPEALALAAAGSFILNHR